jgi:hypothetical protein
MNCTYCGSDVRDHDPVAVVEGVDDDERAGVFCNYACLSSWIAEEDLTAGAACAWSPE